MLAVFKDQPNPGVSIKQTPDPIPSTDEVLVKVKYASICGTDISIYDWTPWAKHHINPPIIIGHEVVGEVLEINGTSDKLKKGDLISSETHIFCGSCYQCSIGNKHICENLQLFGIGRNGGFAQYATIPIKTTWKNNPSLDPEVMSVQEPLGNAVSALSKADVKGKTVLIMGLGPVGLCAASVAKASGAKKVYGVNPTAYRRELGLTMGLDEAFESLPNDLIDQVDVVLEMSGHEQAVTDSLKAVRISGTLIFFGIPKKEVPVDIGQYIINKELHMEGAFGRKIWQTWEEVDRLLSNHTLDLKKIITHRFPLSEFEEAMKVMKSENCGKILLIP